MRLEQKLSVLEILRLEEKLAKTLCDIEVVRTNAGGLPENLLCFLFEPKLL